MVGTMTPSRVSDAQGPFPDLMSRPFDERVGFLSGTSRDLRIQTDGLPQSPKLPYRQIVEQPHRVAPYSLVGTRVPEAVMVQAL